MTWQIKSRGGCMTCEREERGQSFALATTNRPEQSAMASAKMGEWQGRRQGEGQGSP
jgi:hypothetical protein